MNYASAFSLLLLLSLSLAGCHKAEEQSTVAPTANPPVESPRAKGTSLIITYDAKVGKKPLLAAAQKYQAKVIYDYNIIDGIAVVVPATVSLDEAMRYFNAVPGVVAVEEDKPASTN